MATTEPDTTPVDLAQEPMRRALAEQFSETPPTPPLKGCGPGKQLALGCFFDGTRNNRWMLDERRRRRTRTAPMRTGQGRARRVCGRDKRYWWGRGRRSATLPYWP
jgi:hypothetical protein